MVTDPRPAAAVAASHWVVVPLFANATEVDRCRHRLNALLGAGFGVVLVDNNPDTVPPPAPLVHMVSHPDCRWIVNGNQGGIAGGLNRGIHAAIAAGASIITLLDQDSILDACSMRRLCEPLVHYPGLRLLVGPKIWDKRRGRWHQPARRYWHCYQRTRLLISSGTTFAAAHWLHLGPLDEELFIDFVDHAWCFRAQAAGFVLLQHPQARLEQQFGKPHPNRLCRWLGMELYSPERHYTSLRNLRWLVRQGWVPFDLRCKELLKMLLKPWLWLLFEPRRSENAKVIVAALRSPLPAAAGLDSALLSRKVPQP